MEIYTDGRDKHEVEVKKKGKESDIEQFAISIDGFPYLVHAKILKDGRVEFNVNGKTFRCLVTEHEDERFVFHEGHSFKLKKIESGNYLSDEQGLVADKVKAPMPSVIIQYLVKEGQVVQANQKVLIIEAMKMQNTLVAPYAGIVEKINYKKGDQVNEGDELIIIKKNEV